MSEYGGPTAGPLSTSPMITINDDVEHIDTSNSDSDAPSLSEAARERETFKYDSLEISTAALRNPEAAKPIPSTVLSATPDPGLTAFAQLGLYRLAGSRALVSLFDRKNQHIVAEAVRATPLNLNQDQLDQLWLCGTAVPRATSICEHVLAGPAASLTIPGNDTGGAPSDLPVSVVLNLDQDSRFCDVKDTQKRFYIGVPIRSPAGINIGVYCVFDDKPRQHVSADEIQFIRDMSRTVMDYLDAKRSHEWHRREERMVRGLGSFVEGKATLSNWSQSSNPSSFQDIPGIQEGTLNKRLRGADRRPSKVSFLRSGTEQGTTTSTSQEIDGNVHSGGRATGTLRSKTQSTCKNPLSSGEVLQDDVERVFSKASNIIRESIEVEGVVFLDASIRTFGGLIGLGQEMPSPPAQLGKQSPDVSEFESSSDEIPASQSGDTAEATCCRVLGHSTSQSSSVNGDEAGHPLGAFPEKFLHFLLQRYPHGKIYNMEVQPLPLAASDLSTTSRRSGRATDMLHARTVGALDWSSEKPKRRSITATLSAMFPGATSVAFMPLWDSQRNRWFAGSFVWTRTPTRIFTREDELSYLKVYSLTIMAEVTRLHIKAADRTKMDVLGSISHELRSPLHGVVGAAELLLQTHLNSSQQRILRTIQISSRTLLDTIGHILDYGKLGKMNPLIRSSSRLGRRNSARRPQNKQDPASATPDLPEAAVQLDRLTEEVLESVLAGYTNMNLSTDAMLEAGTTPTSSHRRTRRSLANDSIPKAEQTRGHGGDQDDFVQTLLDIEPAKSWSFRIHPGAFRRIVMNLVGNSLKFTKAGLVKVHLRQQLPPEEPDKQAPGVATVLLTVSDTGKGMSEEYLRNQLYTPFAQEDPFAPGTGLGLSLVRQVVTALGGEIHVESQAGSGTSVTVSMPLSTGEGSDEDEEEDGMFRVAAQELAGLRVALRGYGQETTATGATGHPTAHGERQAQVQLELVRSLCEGWLGMQVVPEAQAQCSPPDFVISARGSLPPFDGDGTSGSSTCPHIFICPSLSVHDMNVQVGQNRLPLFVEVVSQPLGPRKLAKSLFDARRRWTDALGSSLKSDSSETLAEEKTLAPSPQSGGTEVASSSGLEVSKVEDTASEILALASTSTRLEAKPRTELQDDNFGPHRPEVLHAGLHASSESVATLGPTTTQRSVLIVDDNPINIKILAAYIKKLHQPYRIATNGLEALDMYTQSPYEYNCLLTDISMPVMDGLESSRRIRKFEREQNVPPCKIIALTGLSGIDVEQDAFASGVDVFLTRPVTMKDIVVTLEELGIS